MGAGAAGAAGVGNGALAGVARRVGLGAGAGLREGGLCGCVGGVADGATPGMAMAAAPPAGAAPGHTGPGMAGAGAGTPGRGDAGAGAVVAAAASAVLAAATTAAAGSGALRRASSAQVAAPSSRATAPVQSQKWWLGAATVAEAMESVLAAGLRWRRRLRFLGAVSSAAGAGPSGTSCCAHLRQNLAESRLAAPHFGQMSDMPPRCDGDAHRRQRPVGEASALHSLMLVSECKSLGVLADGAGAATGRKRAGCRADGLE